MNAVQAGRMFDLLPPGQSMSRQAFIKQVVALTDPDAYHRDAQQELNRREKQRINTLKIQRAIDGN